MEALPAALFVGLIFWVADKWFGDRVKSSKPVAISWAKRALQAAAVVAVLAVISYQMVRGAAHLAHGQGGSPPEGWFDPDQQAPNLKGISLMMQAGRFSMLIAAAVGAGQWRSLALWPAAIRRPLGDQPGLERCCSACPWQRVQPLTWPTVTVWAV